MPYMNDYDVIHAARLHRDHPVLGPASTTLANLADWADDNSDGWIYWPKPQRAATKLMELIERGTDAYFRGIQVDFSADEYRRALTPIKAFRTRHGADFEIVEVSK